MVKYFCLCIFIFLNTLVAASNLLFTQPETPRYSWDEMVNCLEKNISFLDSKLYDFQGKLLMIRNFKVENDKLVVQNFNPIDNHRELLNFDLHQLESVMITNNNKRDYTLVLKFVTGQEDRQNNSNKYLRISNCTILEDEECIKYTWSQEDDFVIKILTACQEIIRFNKIK